MTSCFVCATLNLGRKKSTGTEPYVKVIQVFGKKDWLGLSPRCLKDVK